MDADTQLQLDELREHLESARRIRAAHQRRRDGLQEQAARMGRETPLHVTQEIADLIGLLKDKEAEIREVESRIIKLETTPAPETVLSIPDQAPYIPALVPALVDERLRSQDRTLEWVRDAIKELRELVDLTRDESREWRAGETRERQAGMQAHQDHHNGLGWWLRRIAVLVLVIVVGVVAVLIIISIEVF